MTRLYCRTFHVKNVSPANSPFTMLITAKSLLSTLALACTLSAAAADWQISTYAGTGQQGGGGDNGPATQAQINNPFGLTRGPDDALYFCEYTGQRIRKVTPDGIIHTVAGTGQKGYSGDGGPALQATFNLPHELRFDAAGDLYIVDMTNHAVRKVAMKTGIITTVAGTGKPGYSGDGGPASAAQFKQPHSIQFGPDGALYVCDIGNHVIRKIDMTTGLISAFAGIGKAGPTPDGSPIAGTALNGPRSLDFDKLGNLWLCTREGNQVFKFDLAASKIYHMAGTGKKGLTGNDGPAKEATLSGPKGIAIDSEANVWLADCESHTIRMIEAKTGHLILVAGNGQKGNGADGDPLKCEMGRPHGVFADADGSIYIGDSEAHKVRVLKRK